MSEESQTSHDVEPENIPTTLPLLPLRDIVLFPYMLYPVLLGREASIAAITSAVESDKYIFVCTQKDADTNEANDESMFHHGVVSRILQVLKLPNGLMKVLVDGLFQATVESFEKDSTPFPRVRFRITHPENMPKTTELRALMRHLDLLFRKYVNLHRDIPNEVLISFEEISDGSEKLYYASANILAPVAKKQEILTIDRLLEQYYYVIQILLEEIDVLKAEQEIDDKVQTSIQKAQRKFYIQEQIRILQKELDDPDSSEWMNEDEPLFVKIKNAGMPEPALEKAMSEYGKLRKTPDLSPEAAVIRNYLDWLCTLPWSTFTEDNLSISHAKKVLDTDHYGLDKPKERILEHIAVLNLVKQMKGQILCFVGPPGVGKTSLGKSIARALDRKFVRISLGGIHDEAEIRGHRRTYIGSMPGKIIQAMDKADSANPVLLLDEIDKMSSDFHGDPTSAMLEVLDPEQNSTFVDHYLDTEFDLSKVMFITTANVRYNIPPPLQDRMEIIELPGYLEHEKLEIAKRHLLKKEIEAHGLKSLKLKFEDDALLKIIREYTYEAGVRNLERSIATICRKIAKEVVEQRSGSAAPERSSLLVSMADVEKHLGVPRHRTKIVQKEGRIGSVTGLAWTSAGGDILHVDTTIMSGKEKLTLTGQLGDVMKESAHAGLSFIRSHAEEFGASPTFFEKQEIHIHLPEGAIPKDGPSAGITMVMSMLSALLKKAPSGEVAMTGEITLHGEVLPIGGLTEKLLAAQRFGIKTVLIPLENEKDLKEMSKKVLKGLKIVTVSTITEAIPYVFPVEKSDTSMRPPRRTRSVSDAKNKKK